MKTMIIAAMLVAIPLAAQAEATTIERESTTVCKRAFRKNVCHTESETVIRIPERKVQRPPEPPRPILPPSQTMTPVGVVIMRGMPLR
jgi:hypothetical protein